MESLNKNWCVLKELNLDFNSIGETGGLELAKLLPAMKTNLVKLSLGSNELKDHAVLEIIKACCVNEQSNRCKI